MPMRATPAITALDAAGVHHVVHEFDRDQRAAVHVRGYGMEAAAALGADPDRVFKTLVATLDGREQVVAVVPVSGQLSLKELAAALGAKRAEMCPVAVAERITGYVAGGISPIGQKRPLRTVVDETCVLFDTVFVSGGRRGLDIELAPDDLVRLTGAVVAAIAVGLG